MYISFRCIFKVWTGGRIINGSFFLLWLLSLKSRICGRDTLQRRKTSKATPAVGLRSFFERVSMYLQDEFILCKLSRPVFLIYVFKWISRMVINSLLYVHLGSKNTSKILEKWYKYIIPANTIENLVLSSVVLLKPLQKQLQSQKSKCDTDAKLKVQENIKRFHDPDLEKRSLSILVITHIHQNIQTPFE